MREDKQKAIIILLVINIILICYFGITMKKQLNRNNTLISNKFYHIDDRIVRLQNSVLDDIKNTLNERYNMIDNINYSYANIDADKNKAVLDFIIDLKAVNANSKIYLSYNGIDDKDVQEVELVKIKGLSYGANVELDLNKNYQYNVIEKVDGGGESLLNTSTQNVYLYDEFYKRRVQMHGGGSGWSDLSMDVDFSFSINDFGIEKYGLDKVLLEVWYKDKLIDKIDVTDNIIFGNGELLEQYNRALDLGEIEVGTSIEEFKRITGYQMSEDDKNEYYFYRHKIVYATDYPDLELNMTTSQLLNLNLIITCKDGYTHGM